MLKDEAELERSLWSNAPEVSTDSKVGPIYPLPGGSDPTTGWVAKAGALEEFEVEIGAAPHHVIPGKAAMAKSTSLEKWTRADKGKIKEDIGYSIDCARNGIFLPHVPVIYWTRHKLPERVPMSQHYGQTWKGLSNSSKQSIGYLVMLETWLQMHYTDHSAPYNPGTPQNYDSEVKQRCNQLGDLTTNFHILCERSKGDDGKHYPPYSLVHQINQLSDYFKMQITGRPDQWKSWVSPIARRLTQDLAAGQEHLASRALISRKRKK
jgi:hypothetical protein